MDDKEKTTCYLCSQIIDISIRFITCEDGFAHLSCFDADYTGNDIIDLDRMLLVKPGGVLLPYAGDDGEEDFDNVIGIRRKK